MKWGAWICLLTACTSGIGKATCGGEANTCGSFTLQAENDAFALSDPSDRGYTNGTRLLWSWEPAADSPLDRLAGKLCFGVDRTACERYAAAGLGQSMYTPEFLESPRRIIGDRPYGGWLYGTLMVDAVRETQAEHVEIYAGVVGPAAHAEEAQTFVHVHITPTAPDPLGWDTQISDRVGLLIVYEHRWKLLELRCNDRPYLDLTPALGGAVGNVFDYAAAGVTFRAGYNLPPKFFRPVPSLASAMLVGAGSTPPPRSWDAYLFASADQRYVAHNVFLDTDDEIYRIERRPWVRDYRAGATVRIRWLRLQFVQTFRSPEFRPESRRQSFGTWLISVGASP